MSLSTDYINQWNTWNGNELPHQIIKAIDSKIKQCYNKKNSHYLKEKYDKLRNYYNQQWNSII